MVQLFKWIKSASDKLFDPEREARIRSISERLLHGLRTMRNDFQVDPLLQDIDYTHAELATAKEETYRVLLERGWSDGELTAKERATAELAARCLQIAPELVKKVNLQFARQQFAKSLAAAMDDGVLDSAEEEHLKRIASAVDVSLGQFLTTFFRAEGEAFLRGIFLAAVADGKFTQAEWESLLSTTSRLGLQKQDLFDAIQVPAEQFVERVLADAKVDGKLSSLEENTLNWLLANLGLSDKFRKYISGELTSLKALTMINSGQLPVIANPGVETKSGELIHFHDEAIWHQVRNTTGGLKETAHRGHLTLTDNRLIFSAPTKSQVFGYRSIISHDDLGSDSFQIQVEGKPIQIFVLKYASPIPYAILRNAIAMVNQRLVAKSDGNPRHIPREVRQRVWQKYGGRCAECGATEYLEFDHIVPVARGGSNSDNNVQLLCRRCNAKKSAFI